jgi:membrane-associated phospholipid phosphatase
LRDRGISILAETKLKDVLRRLRRNPLVREVAPLLGLYWLYTFVRWFVAYDNPYEAFANAFRIVQLERQLGIFLERDIQQGLIRHAQVVVHFANLFYTVGYFPVLGFAGVCLYRIDRDRFHTFKHTFLLGLGFALVGYSLFPLAPPRLLPGLGFVDTQQVYGAGLYNQESVASLYNPFAAMPSMHFGWALLVGLMAFSSRRRALRLLGVFYPFCMAVVIVTTGHHYILDIAGGLVVVGLAYGLVTGLPRAITQRVPAPLRVGRSGNRT